MCCLQACCLQDMLLFTGIWGFVWLMCFSYLTSKWRRTHQYIFSDHRSTIEAPLAFAFFCLVIYVRECLFLLRTQTCDLKIQS